MSIDLTPEKGLLFRITHIGNIAWLLVNGLHAAKSGLTDPTFVAIGNQDLIGKRARRQVPLPPGGTLSDYVPFYLTPKSPMLLNITTGRSGAEQRRDRDIAILVSSCQAMESQGVTMLYTDRHAYMATAAWMTDPGELADRIDWVILRRHDFARTDSYPDKMERYQAEALAYRHVPPTALLGIGCVSEKARPGIDEAVRASGAAIRVVVRPQWYFR